MIAPPSLEPNRPPSPETSLERDVSLNRVDRVFRYRPNPRLKMGLQKLRGGTLLVLGFLLSPLSWWNDLVFNLPIAYGVGYLCSLVWSQALLPATVAGYWLSNILGILLMQAGVLDLAQSPSQSRNWKQEIRMSIASSTLYTAVIVGLIQFKLLSTPLKLLSEHFPHLSTLITP